MIEARTASEWVVRLQDGEALADGLRGLESNAALIVSGIGMVRDITLGYWNGSEYEAHAYPEPAELLSL
ncbi:MAG: DNA-binding protein, partial [Lentisphaeria bacterium]|nr:DNA-binding protein [Lentisphaeria bacterium]